MAKRRLIINENQLPDLISESEADGKYIRKDIPDTAQGQITLNSFATSNNSVPRHIQRLQINTSIVSGSGNIQISTSAQGQIFRFTGSNVELERLTLSISLPTNSSYIIYVYNDTGDNMTIKSSTFGGGRFIIDSDITLPDQRFMAFMRFSDGSFYRIIN
jgi:hypothetical protein